MRQVLILAGVMAFTTLVSGQGWTHINGKLIQVSGGLNYVWGVNNLHNIYMCQCPCTGSNWQLVPGKLVQVDVNDMEVWGVNSNHQIYKRPVDGSGDGWQLLSGRLTHVMASGNGYIWGVNSRSWIYKCKKPCSGDWIRVSGGLRQIDGGERAVYGVNVRGGGCV